MKIEKAVTGKGTYWDQFFKGARILLSLIIVLPLMSVDPIKAEDERITMARTPLGMGISPSLVPNMKGNISLDLRNIEIVEALKFLAVKADLDLITTKNVSGRITLMVDDVPIRDIFDIMIRSNSLAYTVTGTIYNIMTEDEYENLFGRNFADMREVRVFRLRYAVPEQAFNLIDTLKSSIGRVLVDEDSGTVLVMDIQERITEIEYALSTLEEKNLVKVFNLKYATAKDVADKLKMQIDAKNVGITRADERSNQIIVQTFPERMEQVAKLIDALDGKTKEVLIDTTIVKVKLTDQRDTGIEWEGIFNMAKTMGMTYFGSAPFTTMLDTDATAWTSRLDFLRSKDGQAGAYSSGTITDAYASKTSKKAPGEAMHIGIVDRKRDFDLLIKYLKTLGNTQILSNPKLAVVNNHEARIHVGERQAYVTTTTTTGQSTSTISEDVTFIDVGIKLSVIPTINDDGYVTMKIKPEVSSVVEYLTTPSGNEIPIIDTSTAETTVMVKDDSTIIIGGLRKDEKTDASEGIPFLSDIPVLGAAFKSQSKSTERTELLVVITPHIILGDELESGDDREFEMNAGKEYREYPSFTDESDYERITEEPSNKVRAYSEYHESYMAQKDNNDKTIIEIKGRIRE